MDTNTSFYDPSGRCCPDCHSTDNIRYKRIPKSQLTYVVEAENLGDMDVNHVDYFGPQRDYKCGNCDCEWLMDDSPRET